MYMSDENISYEELLKIKQRFEEMQAIAQFGTWDLDIKSNNYFLSEGARRIFGIARKTKKIKYSAVLNLIHPDDREAAGAALRAAIDERMPYSADYRVVRPGGEICHVREYGSVVYDNGAAVRAFGSLKDITEDVKTQEKIKESEQLYRTLFENTEDAFLIVEPIYGANGRVCDFRLVQFNDRFEEQTGIKPDNIAGRLAKELQPDIERYWIEMCERVAKAGKAIHYQNYSKGTNRWYDMICFPYTQGRVGAIFRDITQRKAAEEALREADDSNKQILESINDGYGMFDKDATVLKIGKKFAERLGKAPEECIGIKLDDYLPEEKYGALGRQRKEFMSKVFVTGKPVEFQDMRNGRWYNHRCYPVFKDGEVKAVSIFWTDITDSKKAGEEERKNEQLRLEAEIFRKKEQEYLELLDGPSEGMRIVDFKEKRVEFSPKWAQRLGIACLTPEELFRTQTKLIHADDLERVQSERREAEKNRLPGFSQEYRVLTADSGYIWILDRGKILYDETGGAVKVYASSMDITERKLAEESLRFQANILSIMDDAVITFDPYQRITYWSPGAQKMYGWTAEEALGKTAAELLGPLQRETETLQDKEETQAAFKRGELVQGENVQRRKDGSEIWVEYHSRAFFDSKGDLAGFATMQRDVTGRKRRELNTELLNSIEEKFSLISDPKELMDSAGKAARKHFGISRLTFYEVDQASDTITGIFDDHDEGHVSAIKTLQLSDYVSMDLVAESRNGRLVASDNILCDPRFAGFADAYSKTSVRSQMVASYVKDGTLRFIITAQHSKPRHWRKDEIELLGELAARIFPQVERKAAAEALRESENRYRRLFEHMLDGFAYCQMLYGEQGRPDDFVYLAVNEAFGKLTGLTDVVGKRVTEVFPDIKEQNPELFEIYSRVASMGNPERFEIYFKPLNIYLLISVYCPHKGYFVAIFDDITERKRAEEALAAERQHFFDVLETLPAMICLISPDHHIVFANKAFREKFGESGGRRCYDYCCGFTEPCSFCEAFVPLKTGQPHHWEFNHPNGSIFLDAYDFPFNDKDGSPLILEMDLDITERKLIEKKNNLRNVILQAIKKVYEQYVYCGTLEQLGDACLKIIEEITGSKASFIGEVGSDGLFHDIAISIAGCNEHGPRDEGGHKRLPGSSRIGGLYGSVLKTGKTLMTNDPYTHPDSSGIPKDHITLTSFLGVPFFVDSSVAGMVAVANREGGYTEDEKEMLEALAPTVYEVLLRKRTEEALKETESKYGQLVKYAPAGIYEIDFSSRRFISVNDILCQLTGYSREELLAMDPDELLDEQSRAKFEARLDRWLKGEKPEQIVDYKMKGKDGRVLDVILDVSFALDENGQPLKATAVVHDITRRKKDEILINRKNRILQVINHIHERSAYCGTMDELELACLETVSAVTGSSASFIGELKGNGLMYEITLIHFSRQNSVPGSIHKALGNFSRSWMFKSVIDNKKTVLINDLSSAEKINVPGPIEISSFLGVPFICDGKALGLIAAANREEGYTDNEKEMLEALAPTIYEVLQRKRAEEALKNSEERLAAELNAVTYIQKISASFVQEGDFDSILYNILKAALLISGAYKGTLHLIKPETENLEVVAQFGFDQSYIDFFSSTAHGIAAAGAKAFERKERVIVEDVTKSPVFAGTPALDVQLAAGVWAVQSTPLINRRGKVIGILSTHWDTPCSPNEYILRYIDLLASQAADIIERKAAEEELRKSEEGALALVKKLEETDRNKNDFLSALSHEIRNPLAAISAGLQLMDISRDERQIKNAKEIMNRQMDQLCSLVDELLDLTRISNNKIELKKQFIDLGKLASLVAKDHMPFAIEKKLKLETELDEGIWIDADPVRIRQIIGNLLHNAFKFTESGSITLSVYEENGQAAVCVRDSGVGISAENLSRIFEPFMQLGRHMERSSGGLGLGLSIVKAIARLHGGDADVSSEGEGKGASFYIRLPMIKRETEPREEGAGGAEGLKRHKILLIEDNKDYSKMMCELLKFLGHDVMSAPDGIKGIRKAKEKLPDVIICDIGLPGINGYETAKRIRKDKKLKNVFLVSLTGYAGPKYAEDAKKAGFDLHITKPVDIEELKRALNEGTSKYCS